MRISRSLFFILIATALSCGKVGSKQPGADAPPDNATCTFDRDAFDASCTLAP
ncbi:MAG: hypothetical protein ACM31C_15620 [Acidobacteriota bacterium]